MHQHVNISVTSFIFFGGCRKLSDLTAAFCHRPPLLSPDLVHLKWAYCYHRLIHLMTSKLILMCEISGLNNAYCHGKYHQFFITPARKCNRLLVEYNTIKYKEEKRTGWKITPTSKRMFLHLIYPERVLFSASCLLTNTVKHYFFSLVSILADADKSANGGIHFTDWVLHWLLFMYPCASLLLFKSLWLPSVVHLHIATSHEADTNV